MTFNLRRLKFFYTLQKNGSQGSNDRITNAFHKQNAKEGIK